MKKPTMKKSICFLKVPAPPSRFCALNVVEYIKTILNIDKRNTQIVIM